MSAAELPSYYGPTPWDGDPGKRWHVGCDGEVWVIDGADICCKCEAQAHPTPDLQSKGRSDTTMPGPHQDPRELITPEQETATHERITAAHAAILEHVRKNPEAPLPAGFLTPAHAHPEYEQALRTTPRDYRAQALAAAAQTITARHAKSPRASSWTQDGVELEDRCAGDLTLKLAARYEQWILTGTDPESETP